MVFGSSKLLFPPWELLGGVRESWIHVQHAFRNKTGANFGWLLLALPFMSVAMVALALIPPLDMSESSHPTAVKPLIGVFI